MRQRGIARSQSLLLLAALVGMGCSLALTILAGRTMRAADFGVFALVATIFSLARDATDLGTTALACRDTARDPASEVAAIEDLLAWRLVPCALIALACLAIGWRRGDGAQMLLFAATGLVILYAHNNALFAVFQARQLQHVPARIVIVTQAATLAVALCGIAVGGMTAHVVLFLPALIVLREVAAIAWSRRAAIRLLGATPRARLSRDRLSRVFLGGISLYALAALCLQVVLNSGTFLLDLLARPADLGVYAAAFRPMTPLFGLCWLLAAPLSPVLSYCAIHRPDDFARQVARAAALALGAGAVLAATGVLLAPDIMRIFYGTAVDARAATCLAWLMPALPATAMLAILSPAMLARGRERMLTGVAAGAVLLCIGILPAMIAARGPVGAAIAITATLALAGLALVAILRPRRSLLAASLLPALVAALLLRTLLATFADAPWPRIAAGAIVATAALLALWFAPGMRAYRREQDAAALLVGAAGGG